MQYITINDSLILWNNLKDRYDQVKLVNLSQARNDWFNLRFLDLKSITKYNSSIYRMTIQFNFCGDNVSEYAKLDKTYSILPASSMLLQHQYWKMGFKKHSKLLSHLLIAEQHDDFLIKNYESWLIGSMSLLEVNQANYHQWERGCGSDRHRRRGFSRVMALVVTKK